MAIDLKKKSIFSTFNFITSTSENILELSVSKILVSGC